MKKIRPKSKSPIGYGRYSQADVDAIVDLRKQGNTISAISQQLGIPWSTVRYFIKDRDIERPLGPIYFKTPTCIYCRHVNLDWDISLGQKTCSNCGKKNRILRLKIAWHTAGVIE